MKFKHLSDNSILALYLALRAARKGDAYKQAVVVDIKNERAHFRLGELYLRIGTRDLAGQKYRFLRFLKSRYADELLRDINKK